VLAIGAIHAGRGKRLGHLRPQQPQDHEEQPGGRDQDIDPAPAPPTAGPRFLAAALAQDALPAFARATIVEWILAR
jgi:hypothetical protein